MASESKADSALSGTRKEKYDETLDAVIPAAESLAASGQLSDAIEKILAVEKRARLVSHLHGVVSGVSFEIRTIDTGVR
jgi:hypothetical protein